MRTSADPSGVPLHSCAIVTASTDGIGIAVARRLFAAGHCLLINGRDTARVEAAKAEMRPSIGSSDDGRWIDGVTADLAKPGACAAIWEALDRHATPLRAVFVNTPTPALNGPSSLRDEDWSQAVQGLVRFPDEIVRRAAEVMAASGGGAIVVNASCSARAPVDAEFYLANTLRSVSVSQAKAYARRYAPTGVRVNVLLTGYVDTRLTRGFAAALARGTPRSVDDLWKEWEGAIPLQRFAKPDEIARVAAFLLSEEASYITGAALEVDGGLSTHHYNF